MSLRYDRTSVRPSLATPSLNSSIPIRRGTISTHKRSSKLGREVFTSSRPPLAPRHNVNEGQPASDKLLSKLGFSLLNNTWYHSRATFGCVNTTTEKPSSCKWGRGTIFRYPASTGTRSVVESLYRPLCVNENCQWNATASRIMRLNTEGLVSLDLAGLKSDTLPKKLKGKSSPQSAAVSNMTPIEPSSKVSTEEPVQTRKIHSLPANASSCFATPRQARQKADLNPPLPSTSPMQENGTKRKEPPPADSPPPQMPKNFRIDMTERQDFQVWKASRALSTDEMSNQGPALSTYERLDKANRKIAELEGIIEGLKSESRKRRRGN